VVDTARAAASAGFTGADLVTAVAVAGAEPGYVPTATHVNADGSVDYGLWQINSSHASLLASGDWRNPVDNARMAYEVWLTAPSGGRNWSPWTTYRTGAYQPYMPTGQQAVQQLGTGSCASSPSGASGVVAWALAHLGIPYLWGGCLAGVPSCGAPSSSGRMHCSGFSSAAWWFGAQVAIPRTAAEQWRAATPVPAGQEQPGDLIFGEFGPAGPGHVMIVIMPGNPGVAAEEPHTGDVSRTTSYSEGGASLGRPD
jgi:cell wall-associated NlpC family hydrolase